MNTTNYKQLIIKGKASIKKLLEQGKDKEAQDVANKLMLEVDTLLSSGVLTSKQQDELIDELTSMD